MKVIQPYFVMATLEYHKEIMMKNGIAHFYEYRQNSHDIANVMAVPDGCVDIVFEKDAKGLAGRVAGTVLEQHVIPNENEKEYFGVRFLPGVLPAILDVSLADLVSAELNLTDILSNRDMLKEMEEHCEGGGWVEVFLHYYEEALSRRQLQAAGKNSDIVRFVQDEIMNTSGNISIAQLSDDTGYTQRYVNRLFSEETGLNPKTFGKIVKFQRVLQMINEEPPEVKLTDIGIAGGYYDQPHFIKEFKKYAACTPKEYRRLIAQCNYSKRIVAHEVHG